MVGKAGGRQPQAPINWLSSQRSPEMKGCVHQLEAHAAFVKVCNMRPRHRGFTHRRMMALDGGLGLYVQCHPERHRFHAWYSGLVGLHMVLGVSFKARCLPCTVSIWNWKGVCV